MPMQKQQVNLKRACKIVNSYWQCNKIEQNTLFTFNETIQRSLNSMHRESTK